MSRCHRCRGPVASALSLVFAACSSGGSEGPTEPAPPTRPPVITGDAVVDLALVATTGSVPPPPPAPGFELLPMDLNDGTGGDYVWLFYKMGAADGSDGVPITEIYTVNENDGEVPAKGGERIGDFNSGMSWRMPMWLYVKRADWPVVRGVVVANESKNNTFRGPIGVEDQFDEDWVRELIPDGSLSRPAGAPQPFDAQDLNEGDGIFSDFIYLGFYFDGMP